MKDLTEEQIREVAKWFLQGSDFTNMTDFMDERDRITCLTEFVQFLISKNYI